MLGILDFTGSELWAPFNLPYRTALKSIPVFVTEAIISEMFANDH